MMRRTMPIRKRATAPRTWRGAYVTLTAAPAGRAQEWGALPGAGRGGIWAGTPQPGSADAVRRQKNLKRGRIYARGARGRTRRRDPRVQSTHGRDAARRGGGVSTVDAEATLRLTGFSLRYCRLATVHRGYRDVPVVLAASRGSGRSPGQGPVGRGFDPTARFSKVLSGIRNFSATPRVSER
jgi:hypothetical protein